MVRIECGMSFTESWTRTVRLREVKAPAQDFTAGAVEARRARQPDPEAGGGRASRLRLGEELLGSWGRWGHGYLLVIL